MQYIVKGLLSIVVLVLSAALVNAQRSELGFGIGTFNYTGDLVRTYNLNIPNLPERYFIVPTSATW